METHEGIPADCPGSSMIFFTELMKRHILHIALILIFALLIHHLPFFVSGVPLRMQLLSDAESRMAIWQIAQNPDVFSNDPILTLSLKTLPSSEEIISRVLVSIGSFFSFDLFEWSVILSFCSLFLFLCGLYWLTFYSVRDRMVAILVTFFSIIPVHVLGAATFGIQPLGYMPRDMALAVSMYVLLLYVHAVKNENRTCFFLTFFSLGLLTNLYPPLFTNLFLTLLITEVVRKRKLEVRSILFAAAFGTGALPTFVDIVLKSTAAAKIDMELLKSFYQYMMVYPFSLASLKYLRRFLLYLFLVPVIVYWMQRFCKNGGMQRVQPWLSIAAGSFILSVVGLYLESTTTYVKYFFSRASLWFILSSMVITAYGLRMFFQMRFPIRAPLLTIVAVSLIFLFQSNLPTFYRFVADARLKQQEKSDFHEAITRLRDITRPGDVILAPSEEYHDLAASVRTYSARPIYVCYKYGGVVLLDGGIGRLWLQRYQNLTAVFQDKNAQSLIDFMKRENIHYAFVPAHYYEDAPFLQNHLIYKTGHYFILKV